MYFFFFQAEDGIRDLVRSRGLGDVYKRQVPNTVANEWEELQFDFSQTPITDDGEYARVTLILSLIHI